jgi:hypothetical protein
MKQSKQTSNKPSYEQIMQELGIPIYGLEKSQKCHSILVNAQKSGIILESIKKIEQPQNCKIFLRYKSGFFNIQFQRKKGVTHNYEA